MTCHGKRGEQTLEIFSISINTNNFLSTGKLRLPPPHNRGKRAFTAFKSTQAPTYAKGKEKVCTETEYKEKSLGRLNE